MRLRLSRFDSELTQALEQAEDEREQKDKAFLENTALGVEIYTLRRHLQVCVCTAHHGLQTFIRRSGRFPTSTSRRVNDALTR